MKVKFTLFCIAVFVITTGIVSADSFGTGDNQFAIDFVPISGNTNPTSGYGIVNNDYRMGTYEITNDQWNKFKAAYGTVMGSDGGYPSDGYAYGEDATWTGTNVPTNEVSWYEAAQFVNWLNTSTGHHAAYNFTGTQGTFDYTFANWSTQEAYNGTNLFRHKDAYYFLPTENEWVKAAYWNGTSLQAYATIDGSVPVAGVDSNYGNSTSQPWDVGSGSPELNGTFDMMGNVWEWMESPWYIGEYNSLLYHRTLRGIRGGSFIYPDDNLASSFRYSFGPYLQGSSFGFRVASVPEPATLLLFGLGGLALHKRRK